MFCNQNQLHLYIFSLQLQISCISTGVMCCPEKLFSVLLLMLEKSRTFWNIIPCHRLLEKMYPAVEQIAQIVHIQLTGIYLKEEKGGRVVVKLVCKRLTLVVLSDQANRQKAMGCYMGGWGPRVWEDSMSTANQNATDQVTEPVNIADAYDLYRSLNTQ